MPTYPESGVKLVVDTKEAASAVSDLMSQLDDLQGATYTASLDIEVDTADAQAAIDDLPLDGETVDFTVNADVTGTEDLPVDGEQVDTTVNVEETDTAKETLDALNTLKNLKVLETVWNITGTAVDIFRQFGGQILQPMLDLDDAVAKVKATTGDAIPNARTLIKDIFYDDLGESIGQVADLVTQAHQIGAPIDDATRATLTFTHAFTDQNPQQVLQTLDQLVQNKLAPDFKTASDLITTGFQNGANRGNDLLQALNNNATAIHDLGLTGPEALSFIKTGLDNGFTSADNVLKALEKIKQNVTAAAGNATSDVSKTLKMLGIANPAETGDAWTAEFFQKVIDGIKNAKGLSDTEKETLFTNLIGGKQGGKTFSAFLKLSPEEANDIFANVAGAAEQAAKDADDSLTGAFNDFKLAVEKAVEDWLSSSAIDLPGKIAKLKEGLQNALDTLAKGGTLSEALTVALKPIGLDTTFERLESSLGNFIITILQTIESIQRLMPNGGEAADQTAGTIHQMARQQLAFDLKVANPDEIAGIIKTASERGLDAKVIAGSISTAVDELVKSGSPEAAQAIIDSAKNAVGSITFDVQGELTRKMLEAQGQSPTFTVPVTPDMTPEDVQKTIDDTKAQFQAQGFFLDATVTPSIDAKTMADLQSKVDNAVKELNPTMEEATKKITDSTQPLTDMANSTTTVTDNAKDAKPKLDALAAGTDKAGGAAKKAAPAVADTAVSIDDVGLSAMVATVQMQGFGNSIDVVAGKLNSALGAADAVNQQKNQQGAAVNPDQTSGPHAAGGQFAGTALVGEKGAEIVSSNRGVAVLNNMTTENILAALQNFIPGASNVGKSGNTYIANNNNIVNSQAEADSVGYSTARVLRGMG